MLQSVDRAGRMWRSIDALSNEATLRVDCQNLKSLSCEESLTPMLYTPPVMVSAYDRSIELTRDNNE